MIAPPMQAAYVIPAAAKADIFAAIVHCCTRYDARHLQQPLPQMLLYMMQSKLFCHKPMLHTRYPGT
jgi:hypothetical protein